MMRRVRLEKIVTREERAGSSAGDATSRADGAGAAGRASARADRSRRGSSAPGSSCSGDGHWALLLLLEAVADAVERLDHLEIVVDGLELLAQPLDVAVDGPVVDIDLIVIGRIHQRVARL